MHMNLLLSTLPVIDVLKWDEMILRHVTSEFTWAWSVLFKFPYN